MPCLHKYDSEVNNSTPNQIKSLQIDVFVNLGCLYNFTEVYFWMVVKNKNANTAYALGKKNILMK